MLNYTHQCAVFISFDRNINDFHMVNGVDIPCTDGVMIGMDVKIGGSTTILPNTIILGNTVIGEGCTIGPNTYIKDGIIGNNVILDNVKLTDSEVEDCVFLLIILLRVLSCFLSFAPSITSLFSQTNAPAFLP